MNSERAFSQGIESDSNRRPSAREACVLTTMLPRLYSIILKILMAAVQVIGGELFAILCFYHKTLHARNVSKTNLKNPYDFNCGRISCTFLKQNTLMVSESFPPLLRWDEESLTSPNGEVNSFEGAYKFIFSLHHGTAATCAATRGIVMEVLLGVAPPWPQRLSENF